MNGFSNTGKLKGLTSIFVAVAAAGMLLSVSCAKPVDTDAAARLLTQLDADWSRAAATKNADSVAAYYATDAIAYPPSSPIAVGHDAARKLWADGFADTTYSISWKTDHAEVSKSGDMGFTAGTYEESSRGADGKQASVKGKYVCIWAKQADGSWKAVQDIWNTDSK